MWYRPIRSLLFTQNPEVAHELTMIALKLFGRSALMKALFPNYPDAPHTVMGLTFPNPVGLAAGLDKNGDCIDALFNLGFGFVEVGTVTPKPQPGNDKPRLFRLVEAEGIINRMGFNNKGVDYLVERVQMVRERRGVIGINIGKNKTTPLEHGKDDYLYCLDRVYPVADYVAVNISSPNTPGLRSLQYGDALDDLLAALKERQQVLMKTHNKKVPIAIKIAPDLQENELEQVADAFNRYQVDGVVATNTTLARENVAGMRYADEQGGLSGKPLQDMSTQVIASLRRQLDSTIPIMGVGGIDSGPAAAEKIAAGAELVQIYSGFIYRGPDLIREINDYLLAEKL